MIIFVKLLLAHLLGDFALQPKSWVKEKEVKKAASLKLYLHVLLHGLLILLLFWDYTLWLLALAITASHYIIDLLKLYLQKESTKPKWFIVDQFLHILVLGILGFVWFGSFADIVPFWHNPVIWIFITAILFLTLASGIIIQVLLGKWASSLSDGEDDSLANAGKYIGILERLFVFVFVVTGNWQAVGFLLAAKSVFRFGDLKESKDRKLTEYILIGTLLSFGIAILTGLLVLEMI
jgi:hypothetical protein